MRERTKGGFADPLTYTNTVKYKDLPDVVSTGALPWACTRPGQQQTTRDVVTPGFKQRSQEGEIINNPFYTEKLSVVGTVSRAEFKRTAAGDTGSLMGAVYSHTGAGDLLPNYLAIDPALSREVASTAAWAKVAPPDIQSLVELAELPEAIKMFRNAHNEFYTRLKQISASSSFIKSGQKLSVFIASQWLQMRYGFLPILQTLEAIQEMLKGIENPPRLTARGYNEVSSSDSGTVALPVFANAWSRTLTYQRTTKVSVRAGVLYNWTLSGTNMGAGTLDLPEAAWELIPFSFIVDWFFNVGTFLSAIKPVAGTNILSTWTTTRVRSSYSWSVSSNWIGASGYESVQSPSGSGSFILETVTREPSTLVGLSYIPGSFDRFWTSINFLDALAIIRQMLGVR